MKKIEVGQTAPSFEAKTASGKTVRLSDFKGKTVVLYFYPKDNTPGCTTQACNLRDHYSTLQAKGIEVLGVSADPASSHEKFAAKFELPFDLLLDENKDLIQAYGVWGPKKFMGREYDGIHRTTFIIDPNQEVIGVIEKPKTKYHAEEILELIDKK